jgi:hypothetical protein
VARPPGHLRQRGSAEAPQAPGQEVRHAPAREAVLQVPRPLGIDGPRPARHSSAQAIQHPCRSWADHTVTAAQLWRSRSQRARPRTGSRAGNRSGKTLLRQPLGTESPDNWASEFAGSGILMSATWKIAPGLTSARTACRTTVTWVVAATPRRMFVLTTSQQIRGTPRRQAQLKARGPPRARGKAKEKENHRPPGGIEQLCETPGSLRINAASLLGQ